MKKLFVIFTEDQWLTAVTFGALAFSLILVTTLNLNLAFFSLIVFSSLGIFRKSFHYGLSFFLVVILVFPSVNIIDNLIATRELFVLILFIIGISSLILDKYKFKMLPVFYYGFALIVLYIVVIIFFRDESITSSIFISTGMLAITGFVYLVLIILFKHFFQTTRRLERLFLVIVAAGTIQVIIGLVFKNNVYGVLKIFQLGQTYWVIILSITIPITLGAYLIQKDSLSTISNLWFRNKGRNIYKVVDTVLTKNNFPKEAKKVVINLKKTKINIQRMLIFSLALQILGLITTSSYILLITISIGIFIIGVLMRDKKIILGALGGLIVSMGVFSEFRPSLVIQLKQITLDIILSIKNAHNWSFFWRGFIDSKEQLAKSTYLFIFNKLGLIGFIIFSLGLIQYFREIRFAYLKSEEFERIWLIVILSIFVEFLFLGIFSNVFFIGPASLLFWILYGVLQNLKNRKREYQLLGTNLVLNK